MRGFRFICTIPVTSDVARCQLEKRDGKSLYLSLKNNCLVTFKPLRVLSVHSICARSTLAFEKQQTQPDAVIKNFLRYAIWASLDVRVDQLDPVPRFAKACDTCSNMCVTT